MRISVSDLEGYRYWKDNEESTLDELLARLRHEEPPTDRMLAGKAFAKLMERGGQLADVEEVDGWRFVFALDATIERPAAVELKGEMVIDTPSGPVTLVCKCDGLLPGSVHDQKLTEKWDAEKYLDSVQWRAYLLMFERKVFVYDVFEASYKDRTVTIRGHHPLACYAYPEMRRDVERAVAELAEVIARHLPERLAA